MCSIFDIKINSRQLEDIFGNPITPSFEINSQVFPGYKSFILIQGEKGIESRESNYGLAPSWAQKKIKFATYNARSETIFEKPTWRDPIRFKRCLVPLNSFYESIYEKKFAGHLVKFSSLNDSPLIAAGIWDSWVNPNKTFRPQFMYRKYGMPTPQEHVSVLSNGSRFDRVTSERDERASSTRLSERRGDEEEDGGISQESSEGFAIITRNPLKYIDEAGHDRSPIFMHKEYFNEWLDPKSNGNEKLILSLLNSQPDDIEFKAEAIRELKGHNKNQMKLF